MTLHTTTIKPKTCTVCKASFTPARMGAKVCGPMCAMTFARSVNVKAAKVAAIKERKETRVKLEKLKSRSQWAREAQAVVNKYVRLRDHLRGLGCVTCGAYPQGSHPFDAGHLRSVGSAPHLRFMTSQISLQCVPCNRHQGGRALIFRQAMVQRRGSNWVEALEAMQGLAKFDISYLERLKSVFAKRCKRLEKRLENVLICV